MFKEKSAQEIIDYCYEMRDKFGLNVDNTNKYEINLLNKEPFRKARDYINENPSTLGYFFLTYYSFLNQFRFSQSNKFNMPCGNGYFKSDNEKDIKIMCDFFNGGGYTT